MSGSPVFVVSAARTPIGSFLGALAPLRAPELGSLVLRAALDRAGVAPALVDEVFVGQVLSAGAGQAPARQAALGAGVPNSVPCTTVNKVCGSGLQTVILGARTIAQGDAELVLAGGMESMSNVPYYLDRARQGYRMGDAKLVDGMIFDGLWDPYNDFHMGRAGELCAAEYQLTRNAQDAFAAESYRRARKANEDGSFAAELVPVQVPQRKGAPVVVGRDEEPFRGDPERFAKLEPVFSADGTITAANASSINDGAAALLLASQSAVERHGLEPLAKIAGFAAAAQAPEWFTTAPVKATQALLEKVAWSPADVDLWEINEAFACVTMACSKLVGLDPERVNVRGGAVALGHPIGASGARILTTLLFALRDASLQRGVASICIGGGEALALAVERHRA
ncbi:MAG TPA: thiolase family protein [Polyangiaceae bacterium]